MRKFRKHFLFFKDKNAEENKVSSDEKAKKGIKSSKKNNVTELVFIIDKSGSMQGLEKDTIGGFNAMIEKQKKEEGEAYVTTVFFNTHFDVVHDRVELSKVEPLTEQQYRVGGCTALLDAIGWSIGHISSIHRYARPKDVPAKTIFLITTDGMENASQRYLSHQIKMMIKAKEECGWEFIFVAANIDAVETAESIGIRSERAASYKQNAEGTDRLYCAMSEAVASYRRNDTINNDWRSLLDEFEDKDDNNKK